MPRKPGHRDVFIQPNSLLIPESYVDFVPYSERMAMLARQRGNHWWSNLNPAGLFHRASPGSATTSASGPRRSPRPDYTNPLVYTNRLVSTNPPVVSTNPPPPYTDAPPPYTETSPLSQAAPAPPPLPADYPLAGGGGGAGEVGVVGGGGGGGWGEGGGKERGGGQPSLAAVEEAVRRAAQDDSYAFLAAFDVAFLVDDSASMWGRSWRETREVLAPIARKCIQYDADGIDVYFMNHRTAEPSRGARAGSGYLGLRSEADVARLFDRVDPNGATPTGRRLRSILSPYLAAYCRQRRLQPLQEGGEGDGGGLKPLVLIVITDGVPSDDVESEIVRAARVLDALDAPAYQIGIQFFQVGSEAGAGDVLDALDDDLQRLGVRDMVDTVKYRGRLDEDTMRKTVLGSVIRRLDAMVLS